MFKDTVSFGLHSGVNNLSFMRKLRKTVGENIFVQMSMKVTTRMKRIMSKDRMKMRRTRWRKMRYLCRILNILTREVMKEFRTRL